MDPEGKHVGRVKFFNEDKGFGFIEDFDAETDVFVHISNVIDSEPLRSGDVVRFAVAPSRRKKSEEAQGVVRLSSDEAAERSAKYAALAPDLRIGRVKFFDSRKGFGFIHDFSEDADIYLGASEVKNAIRDRDLVVFERRSSPRKRGTDEACDVRRVADFEGDEQTLLACVTFDSKVWSKEVEKLVPHLDKSAQSRLVEQAIEAWTPLDADSKYGTVVRFHKCLNKLKDSAFGVEAETYARRFRTAVAASALPVYKKRLWSAGWDEAFDVETVVASFAEEKNPELLRGLSGVQYRLVVERIVESTRGDAKAVQALLDAALLAMQPGYAWARSAPQASSERLRLIEKSTQPDRYETALQMVAAAVSPDVLFRLFLDGFSDAFDEEVARLAACDLNRSELLRLLDHKAATENLKLDLLSNYVDRTIPEEESSSVEGVEWALKQSRKVLATEQADDLEAAVLDRLSEARQFELWETGASAAYPESHVRSVAGTLERARFARVLKASAHGTVKDLLDIRLEHALRGEERLDHVEWLWKLAIEHLAEGESEAFHHKTLDALSSEERFALWGKGWTEQYPEHIVRERVQELTRSQLDRICQLRVENHAARRVLKDVNHHLQRNTAERHGLARYAHPALPVRLHQL